MCEIVMCAFVVVAMVKIASHEDLSPWVWGAISLAVCVLCLLIPLPFIRVGIALVLSFAVMIVYNIIQSRR